MPTNQHENLKTSNESHVDNDKINANKNHTVSYSQIKNVKNIIE